MNLSKEVIEHERIKTTEAKAKAVKPELEKLITLAKRGDLHARRQALSALGQDSSIVHQLFEVVAPRYETRHGGYTQRQRIPGEMLVKKPAAFSLAQTMAIGTAGFTAMLCVLALEYLAARLATQ